MTWSAAAAAVADLLELVRTALQRLSARRREPFRRRHRSGRLTRRLRISELGQDENCPCRRYPAEYSCRTDECALDWLRELRPPGPADCEPWDGQAPGG